MTTKDLLSLHNGRFRLFGLPALQGQGDVAFIDRLVYAVRPQVVVEIGAGGGALSLYLYVMSQALDFTLYSYDIEYQAEAAVLTGLVPRETFITHDIRNGLPTHVYDEGVLVLVDDDDKPYTASLVGAALGEGGVVAAHDWLTRHAAGCPFTQREFTAEGCDEFMLTEAELLYSDWRAWRKR